MRHFDHVFRSIDEFHIRDLAYQLFMTEIGSVYGYWTPLSINVSPNKHLDRLPTILVTLVNSVPETIILRLIPRPIPRAYHSHAEKCEESQKPDPSHCQHLSAELDSTLSYESRTDLC